MVGTKEETRRTLEIIHALRSGGGGGGLKRAKTKNMHFKVQVVYWTLYEVTCLVTLFPVLAVFALSAFLAVTSIA